MGWISHDALAAIREEAARHPRAETGGLVLGYRQPGALVITGVLGPGPDAVHLGRSFRPDSAWQERQLAAAYAASGRTITYLGDWHTHPGGTHHPSRRDLRTLRRIARTKSARQPEPLLLILAPDPDGAPAVWWRPASGRRALRVEPSPF